MSKAVDPGSNLKDTVPEDETDVLNDHEARGHLNTLMDAHHILNHPDKMKRVHALAGRHSEALHGIKSVSDLKAVYQQKYGLGHLSSSPHQQNDVAHANNEGDGNTGNAGEHAPNQHQASSSRQENNLGAMGGRSGTGNTGNKKNGPGKYKSSGHVKSSKQQKNDEVVSEYSSGSGNDGN